MHLGIRQLLCVWWAYIVRACIVCTAFVCCVYHVYVLRVACVLCLSCVCRCVNFRSER